MKQELLLFLTLVIATLLVKAQEGKNIEGTVSHVTSSSVYVKFQNTTQLLPGDTLYMLKAGSLIPLLVVTGKSSLSVVASPIGNYKASISDQIIYIIPDNRLKPSNRVTTANNQVFASDNVESDTVLTTLPSRQQQIKGKVSAATYSTFSDTPSGDFHRFRYSLNMQAKNIGGSRLSAESYISFVHKTDYWDRIQDNIFNGLKIYNLALIYEATDRLTLIGGRKINPKLSSMGPVDGLQAEYRLSSFTVGALVGERPNYADYRFNFIRISDTLSRHSSLFQYGFFISHDKKLEKGNIQTTVAYVDQKNGGVSDRRFTYFQHTNSIIDNFFFFGSVEFDMYKLVNESKKNSPNLSNLYLSGRYRILRNLSFSLSYSARKNIIYYETFKSYIDRYIDNEMQQGYSARVNYSPIKTLSVGASAGYRKRKDDPDASKNAYFYATYNQIPGIKASLTVSATLLKTSYLSGNVYAFSFNRDFLKNKLNTSFTYRYQVYQFSNSEQSLIQHTPEIGFNWYILKKLSMGLNYEATVEESYLIHRVYAHLAKRF